MVKKVPLQIRRISATVCFAVLFIIIVSKISDIFERKYSYSKYYDFYQQKQDFDVLFLGTSHVLNAVYPMELWRDHGIIIWQIILKTYVRIIGSFEMLWTIQNPRQ